MQDYPRVICCLIGASGVGKSSIAKSFGEGSEALVEDPTLNEGYSRKFCIDRNMTYIDVVDSSTLGGIMWITAASKIDVVVCVFSLGNMESFEVLKKQQKQVEDFLKYKVIWVVCGTKADAKTMIDKIEITKFTKQLNAKYYEISLVKRNADVTSIFIQASHDCSMSRNEAKKYFTCSYI